MSSCINKIVEKIAVNHTDARTLTFSWIGLGFQDDKGGVWVSGYKKYFLQKVQSKKNILQKRYMGAPLVTVPTNSIFFAKSSL